MSDRNGRRGIIVMLTSLLGALGALSFSNLSCGTVATNACAQGACPDLATLEARVMDLEGKIQPLLSIAQLQCGTGSVLAWNGAAWECTKTIQGDLVITGNATISRDLTVTGATVHWGATSMSYSRATIQRSGTKIQYFENDTLLQELDIGDGTQALGGGANAYIRYIPGDATGDARLLFNINALHSLACTLLHAEDDSVIYGLAFATDSGNGYMDAWGGIKRQTFILSRQAIAAAVILDASTYHIACF